jgi:nucleotide-binding universal stress UspA family protein
MVDSLVVGVDASTESLDALDAAVKLARQAAAGLYVVHVQHAPSLAAVGEATASADTAMAEALEQAEEEARAEASNRLSGTGIDWSFEVTRGDPAAELIRFAAAHHAAAIIIGGKAHGVVGGLLLGSVAQKLVRQSPVSVVVVRDGEARRLRAPVENGPVEGAPGPIAPREDSVA